ncbi:Uncharacterised protein [Vibrio cholerae]|uniref:Uncharacterized protein n=1 Tax=Vibrio cholerae TaxID=666 RepID=A0A655V122_VIBCL|nr:Uncharacterised protein [Vibrio cholerae]CSA64484.1 Uncharacterised protein [Vibrio cholerae]CSB59921.1 Uncharacterised protein [Vibrio cholerae]CSC45963.1 Uncharacterised protein [Vibrio cholerae]CSC77690.1 Uncharacterised protein [Vibrio cholerae]
MIAFIEQHFRNPAHPRPANANKVDRFYTAHLWHHSANLGEVLGMFNRHNSVLVIR